MKAVVKECIRDVLDHERRLREMPAKRYIVRLTEDERTELLGLITKGITSARLLTRARILLKADEGWKDKEIAQALNSSVATIERIRQRFVEGNLEKALHDDPRPGAKCKLDGRAEAQLIALACSKAPEGHAVWSMRLLAGTLVELGVVESVSHETVRQRLKKTTSSLGSAKSGAYPNLARSSWLRWKMSWMCMKCPTTPLIQPSALMRNPSN